MKNVSIVIPLFNEEGVVDELIKRLKHAVNGLNYSFEFIIVDDGSNDKTLEKLLVCKNSEHRLKILKLSKNWGQQNSYNAGLDNSGGDAVILMDGDLEDPPEIIHSFLEKWEDGYDVVYGVKESRKVGFFSNICFSVFYKLLHFFSEVRVDPQAGMFSLMDRKVVKELKKCSEKNKYYVGLRFFAGFKQTKVNYHRSKRFSGVPKQTFRKLVNYGLNAFFSFSFLPVRLLTYFGLVLLLIMTLMIFIFILGKSTSISFWLLDQIRNFSDWTAIILAIFFALSVQIIFLGILGEYIARIFDEVRSRPYYIIDQIYEAENKNKGL